MAAASSLDAHLGYWLRLVSNHVTHRFARSLAAEGVTNAEWVVLRDLYASGAVPPSAVADRLGLTRGAISKLVERLRAKRLVVRTAAGQDRRFQTIALTGAGAVRGPVLAAIADRNDAEMFGDLTAGERESLAAVLRAIAERHGIRTAPID